MIWIPDDDEHDQLSLLQLLEQLDVQDAEQREVISWVIHVKLQGVADMFQALSELMDPVTHDDVRVSDVEITMELLQQLDVLVDQIRDRWDM